SLKKSISMKLRMTTILGLVATMFIFIACDKDDDDVQASIQHKWSVNNAIFNVESPIFDTSYTYIGTANDYFDFRNDGKLYSHMDNQTDTVNYQFINDSKLLVDGDTFNISVLTNTQLQLNYTDSSGVDSFYQTLLNLTR